MNWAWHNLKLPFEGRWKDNNSRNSLMVVTAVTATHHSLLAASGFKWTKGRPVIDSNDSNKAVTRYAANPSWIINVSSQITVSFSLYQHCVVSTFNLNISASTQYFFSDKVFQYINCWLQIHWPNINFTLSVLFPIHLKSVHESMCVSLLLI